MAGKKLEYLTLKEAATRFGIARQSVEWAVSHGKLDHKVINGKRCVSDKDAAECFGKKKLQKRGKKKTKDDIENMSRLEAERRERVAKALRQELEYERAKGELINIREVEDRVADMARRTREALQGISDRLAPELAAEVDPNRVAVMLRREVDLALEQLADSLVLKNASKKPNTDK